MLEESTMSHYSQHTNSSYTDYMTALMKTLYILSGEIETSRESQPLAVLVWGEEDT